MSTSEASGGATEDSLAIAAIVTTRVQRDLVLHKYSHTPQRRRLPADSSPSSSVQKLLQERIYIIIQLENCCVFPAVSCQCKGSIVQPENSSVFTLIFIPLRSLDKFFLYNLAAVRQLRAIANKTLTESWLQSR